VICGMHGNLSWCSCLRWVFAITPCCLQLSYAGLMRVFSLQVRSSIAGMLTSDAWWRVAQPEAASVSVPPGQCRFKSHGNNRHARRDFMGVFAGVCWFMQHVGLSVVSCGPMTPRLLHPSHVAAKLTWPRVTP
jgi:hypothetical protein